MTLTQPKQKLYCYVDEAGQDTLGKFFIVSVIVTGDARESLVARLEQIERASGKGNVKWTGSRPSYRVAYMKAVLSDPLFKQTLHNLPSIRNCLDLIKRDGIVAEVVERLPASPDSCTLTLDLWKNCQNRNSFDP